MTKKHYEAIAKMVHELRSELPRPHSLVIPGLVNKLCVFFKSDNPSFNEALFREACQ